MSMHLSVPRSSLADVSAPRINLHSHERQCGLRLGPGWQALDCGLTDLHALGRRIRAPVLPRARRLDERAAAAAVARADAKLAAQDLQQRMHSWRSAAEDAAEPPDEPEADPEAVAELVEDVDDEDDHVYGGIFEGRCSRRGSGLGQARGSGLVKSLTMPHGPSSSRPTSAQRGTSFR